MHASHAVPFLYSILFVHSTTCQGYLTFCNRLYHSVVVANNTLYVDGGELRTVSKGNVSVEIPDYISTLDLSRSFSNSDSAIWHIIPKNADASSNGPPTLNDGSIFATNSSLYLFGGALSAAPGAPKVPPPNAIWQYGFKNGNWTSVIPNGDPIQRIHWGQTAQSVGSSTGYYLGGAITPASDAAFYAIPGAQPYQVQGLITFDEDDLRLTNRSTIGFNPDGTALAGFMALIESIGPAGVLIAFGGIMNGPGKEMRLDDADLSDPVTHSSLGNISIYDIGSRQWYRQPATGDIPPWRYVGCSVVVSAPDYSSHSIYVFGGWGNSAGASDGNVYVLSLPSFQWIRVNKDSSLRARHQCALIGKNTMAVIGGIHSKGTNLQPADGSGCDTSPMFSQGIGLFNLNNHTWTTSYDPAEGSATYQIHPSIKDIIGNTVKGPVGGFSQKALGTLFRVPDPPNTTLPTSAAPNDQNGREDLSGGIIAGIVTAAIISIILTLLFIFHLVRYRNRLRDSPRPEISPPILIIGKASELTGSPGFSPMSLRDPVELSDGKIGAYDVDSFEKPLPPCPHDSRHTTIQVQEMEGESGWHPAVRAAMKEEKAGE